MTRERDMTATLGETCPTADPSTADPRIADPSTAVASGAREATRPSPRHNRRDLTARVALSPAGARAAAAMIGVLALVAVAGALVQSIAG